MTATLDFWFDFASTYSYPACLRARSVAARDNVKLRYRPFLLGPGFKAQGWDTSPFNIYEAKGRYMWRDLERLCADLGLTFRQPEIFPQNSLLASRVAIAGDGEDWQEEFCRAVFHAQFGQGRRIDDPDVIDEILSRLGQPSSDIRAYAQTDAVKARLKAQTQEAGRQGIFGAPTFVTPDGELFWGNDRLEAALRWAARKGK